MACEVQPLKVVFTYSTYSTCVSAFLFRAIQSIQTFWNRGRFWHFLEEVSVSFPCLLWTLACGAPRSAVSYIHMNMICHRDLKPENFLISKKCAIQVSPALFRMGDGFGKVKHGESVCQICQDGKVKLIDFGTAKRFDLGPLTTKAW